MYNTQERNQLLNGKVDHVDPPMKAHENNCIVKTFSFTVLGILRQN